MSLELISPDTDECHSDGSETSEESVDEYEEVSDAFHRVQSKSILKNWIEQRDGYHWGFRLEIDEQRLTQLTPATFIGLIDCFAKEMHDIGANESQKCSQCPEDASTIGYFEQPGTIPTFVPYCENCWESIIDSTKGKIIVNQPESQIRGWCTLFAISLGFCVIWGFVQHPNANLPISLLCLISIGSGIGIFLIIEWAAKGSNLTLRIGIGTCVLMAIIIGNIVGVKFLIGPELPWPLLVRFYITMYFPSHVFQELLLSICGLIGVTIGFFITRENEIVRIK